MSELMRRVLDTLRDHGFEVELERGGFWQDGALTEHCCETGEYPWRPDCLLSVEVSITDGGTLSGSVSLVLKDAPGYWLWRHAVTDLDGLDAELEWTLCSRVRAAEREAELRMQP